VVFSLLGAALHKTTIYIDGYNLYYSRLRGTPFKWLDVVALFRDQILAVQDPTAQVVALKYFTAPIKAKYARHGAASEEAQAQYHRALLAKDPGMVQIIKGFHIFNRAALPAFLEGQPPRKEDLKLVWMIEEKQTDVNLALEIYRDAIRGDSEQVVICSNDSDIEPALRFLNTDAPQTIVGLVMPLSEDAAAQGKYPNKRLTALAHWVRHAIRDEELEAAQLPRHVVTRKKAASKPAHW
jgi:uncharacterized LabA/DUF88 family protein